jgi:TonB family protein
MNSAPPVSGGWTRRRFWGVVGLLFVAQASLILLFGGGGLRGPGAVPAPAHFLVLGAKMTADQLSRVFFAADPAASVMPNPHGFSGRAWLDQPPPAFAMPEDKEPPAWLPIDTSRLGTNFPALSHVKAPAPLPQQHGGELEPWPIFLTPELFRTQSLFRLQGAAAGRLLNPPAQLRAWPGAQLLSNTVVQIAVDSAGQVVATRLLERSTSADADQNALGQARNLRFRPAPVESPVWGEAIFEWQTIEPTNGPAARGP